MKRMSANKAPRGDVHGHGRHLSRLEILSGGPRIVLDIHTERKVLQRQPSLTQQQGNKARQGFRGRAQTPSRVPVQRVKRGGAHVYWEATRVRAHLSRGALHFAHREERGQFDPSPNPF